MPDESDNAAARMTPPPSIEPPTFPGRLAEIAVEEVRGRVQVGIITIRPDECEAVLDRLGSGLGTVTGRRSYTLATVAVAGGAGEARVAVVRCLHQGQATAQQVARDFIEDLDPRWLFLTGIAGGAPAAEFSLGDAVLASYLHDFSVSAAREGKPPEFQAMGGYMHPWVENFLAIPTLARELAGWSAETAIGRARPSVTVPGSIRSKKLYGSTSWKKKVKKSLDRHFGNQAGRDPLVHVGPTISSNTLVKDDALLARWKESARAVVSVEMELGGVYQSARRVRDGDGKWGQVPVVAVRGISDIIGFDRDDAWTEYACHSAAALAHALIASGLLARVDGDFFTDADADAAADAAADADADADAAAVPAPAAASAPRPGATRPAARLSPLRLPRAADDAWVGREAELAALEAAWTGAGTHVISLVAAGGIGKTAVVTRWLAGLDARPDDHGGAASVFEWSFYSQGSADQAASADTFIDAALRFHGDGDPSRGTPYERGARLAELVAGARNLLVLDGLEPLQHGPGPSHGRLKDPGLMALLTGLSRRNPGLCVITTRVAVAEIADWSATTAPRLALGEFDAETGADLLEKLGVSGERSQLCAAAEAFSGHALALSLLGTYLVETREGDIRRWREVDLLAADEARATGARGGPARRIMRGYERWLAGDDPDRGAALAVLGLVGLFDRPAAGHEIRALLAPPAIPGLTDVLESADRRNRAITWLRRARLLGERHAFDGDGLDAHPLVREYFGRRLRERAEEQQHGENAWQAGHLRLYRHLCEHADQRPDTLAGLQPLYNAVTHGCLAGCHQEVYDRVYRERIRRGNEDFAVKKLGAFGADLGAVARFFARPWDRPVPTLREDTQSLLLNIAGFCLRALGRPREALAPMQAGLERYKDREDWKNAAVGAGNLAELHQTLGDLPTAERLAQDSVTLADRSGDAFQRMVSRTTLADVLHQRGRLDRAAALFAEAEAIQAEWQSQYPRL